MKEGRLNYTATVPANTAATLYLPATDPKKITESGRSLTGAKEIRFVRYDHWKAVFELQSGDYQFGCQH